MANPEHVELLKQGFEVWNKWREDNPDTVPDLSNSNLSREFLEHVNLEDANLENTNIEETFLYSSDLTSANLRGANLAKTNLVKADLTRADLQGANLTGTYLPSAVLYQTNLRDADFTRTIINVTIFADVDLSKVKNIDHCFSVGPSVVDFRTLQKSWPLPRNFLRDIGLPEAYIDYLPSLFDTSPFQFYTCFISYYHEDQEFAERLHADLQDKGVRDKVILVLSEKTVQSNWVEYEVERTLDEEVRRKADILMPIRLDGSVFDCEDNWAKRISENRSIGDFTRWKEFDEYKKAFEFLMKWLKAEGEGG